MATWIRVQFDAASLATPTFVDISYAGRAVVTATETNEWSIQFNRDNGTLLGWSYPYFATQDEADLALLSLLHAQSLAG